MRSDPSSSLRAEGEAVGRGERERVRGGAQRLPGGGVAAGLPRLQRPRARQVQRVRAAEAGAAHQVLDGAERALRARIAQRLARLRTHPADLAPAHADGGLRGVGGLLQRRVPVAVAQAGGAHLHAVAHGVVHQRGGGVEAHRLRVEEAHQELAGWCALRYAVA
jgi:hypothetical protein